MQPGYGYILSVNLAIIPKYENVGGLFSLIGWDPRPENQVVIRYQPSPNPNPNPKARESSRSTLPVASGRVQFV